MIVRRHVVQMTVHCIGQTVVADIDHDKKIFSADRFAQNAFCLTRTETRAAVLYEIIFAFIGCEKCGIYIFFKGFLAKSDNMVVDLLPKSFAALERGDFKRSCRKHLL